MNKPTEFKENYIFQYTDGDARHVATSFTPGYTWPEVLEQFVDFLSNVYGYNIREKIAISESPFASYDDTWSGPVFNPEESL
jgi:hypothetical protein